jgi:hypothetical protein
MREQDLIQTSGFLSAAIAAVRADFVRTALASTVMLGAPFIATAHLLLQNDRLQLLPIAGMVVLAVGSGAHASRSIPDGLTVAIRLLTLSSFWLVPWALWGLALTSPGLVAASLFALCTLLITPAALIVSIAAKGTLDLVRPSHWSAQLDGHADELISVYLIQAGGVALMGTLIAPVVVAVSTLSPTLTMPALAVGLCALLGGWTTLAGRLCASFVEESGTAAASRRLEREAAPAAHLEEGLAIAGPAIETDLLQELKQPTRQRAVQQPEQQSNEVEVPAEEETEAVPTSAGGEASKLRRYPAPTSPVAFDAPEQVEPKRRTPLLDAERRVEETMKRFRLDPSHTLSKLAELDANFAPNPQVLQALAICLNRTGHPERAVQTASRAFPLCFQQGYVSLAAAMFFELRNQVAKLSFKSEQVLAIAEVLENASELAATAKAYSLVIHSNPDEFRAIKGLLDVADRIRVDKRRPTAAIKVYQFLLDHCAHSGYAELMRDGIARCTDAEQAATEMSAID